MNNQWENHSKSFSITKSSYPDNIKLCSLARCKTVKKHKAGVINPTDSKNLS